MMTSLCVMVLKRRMYKLSVKTPMKIVILDINSNIISIWIYACGADRFLGGPRHIV